ncbi:hypothetical protein [Paenibacillus lentus]|uniref:Uncharacterized protein n=1 Tax=Paenibacillus lentus TaxID=1338368 RepID=A0A3Q8S5A8_9BACL|nr:hypothetical protein [Paenibacillus lentus]AZK47211.1 hypothetical protein EIM92_14455 [Paenibacillus lentus]
MKLRIRQIVAIAAFSAVLLFGGWFGYSQWAIEAPLHKLVQQYEGVNHVKLNITPKEVGVKLDLEAGTDIGGLVRYIEKDGQQLLGKRSLKLEVKDHSSAALDQIWSEALFSVAQAMESRQYTEIQSTLTQLEQKYDTLRTTAVMDNDNVYLTLTDGAASKYVILPRIPQKLGVWPNA